METLYVKFNSQETQGFIAYLNNEMIGHIFFKVEPNQKIKFLDAWVCENHRRKGVYSTLWVLRWNHILENYPNHEIYAWAKDSSLNQFLKNGFKEVEKATLVTITI